MVLAEPLGNQLLDRHAEQLLTRIPEQSLGKMIDDDDIARPIDDDERIGCGFQKPFERHGARKPEGRQVVAIVAHTLGCGLLRPSLSRAFRCITIGERRRS